LHHVIVSVALASTDPLATVVSPDLASTRRMARLPRAFVTALTYHVIHRGNNRAPIFTTPQDYAVFRQVLGDAAARFGVRVHGYVFMTNHVHLMLAADADTSGVPRTMQQVGRQYVPYFNARHARTGALWEGRYRAIPVETETYWLTCLRYVEQNPRRAGMVDDARTYAWSSCRFHACGTPDDLLTPHPLYVGLGRDPGERRTHWSALLGYSLPESSLFEIRYRVHHGWPLGGLAFIERMEMATSRPMAPRSPGPRRRNLSDLREGV
jgi:putative transposase